MFTGSLRQASCRRLAVDPDRDIGVEVLVRRQPTLGGAVALRHGRFRRFERESDAGSQDPLGIELRLHVDGRAATYSLGLDSKDGAPTVASEQMAFGDGEVPTSDRTNRPRLAPTAVLLSEPDSRFQRIADAVLGVLVHWGNTSALATPRSPDYTLPLSQCSWNWSSIAERLLSNGEREALLEATAAVSGVTDVRIRTVGN